MKKFLKKIICISLISFYFFKVEQVQSLVPYYYLPTIKNLQKGSLSIGENAYQLLYFGKYEESLNLAKLAVAVSLETKDNSDTVKNFGKQLSMHIAASNPIALDQNSIDQSILDKEQQLVTEELKNSGKPEEIAQKISLGKMNKFKEENALLTQAWVMEPKKKVQDVIKELAINDLKIKEFSRIKIGE